MSCPTPLTASQLHRCPCHTCRAQFPKTGCSTLLGPDYRGPCSFCLAGFHEDSADQSGQSDQSARS
jgi:hypothetical protein